MIINCQLPQLLVLVIGKVQRHLIGLLWRLRVNELYELLTELIKLGMPAEDIADKLDLECESVTIQMASTWLV